MQSTTAKQSNTQVPAGRDLTKKERRCVERTGCAVRNSTDLLDIYKPDVDLRRRTNSPKTMQTVQRAAPCCARLADIALKASARTTIPVAAARRSSRVVCAHCRSRLGDRRNISYTPRIQNVRPALAVSRAGSGQNGVFSSGYQVRGKASVVEGLDTQPLTSIYGPMQEYDSRVRSGRLRDDEHQRGGFPLYLSIRRTSRSGMGGLMLMIRVFQQLFKPFRTCTSSLRHTTRPRSSARRSSP